jgi:hypothetical protein
MDPDPMPQQDNNVDVPIGVPSYHGNIKIFQFPNNRNLLKSQRSRIASLSHTCCQQEPEIK